MRTILTGRPITSEEALSWGLLCDLMDDSDLLQQTIAAASALTEHGSEALQLAKEAVCRGKDQPQIGTVSTQLFHLSFVFSVTSNVSKTKIMTPFYTV